MVAGFNGSGTYLRAFDWTADKDAAIKIQAIRMDEEMDGFATALSTCITRNGQSTVEANIPMSGFKFTGMAPGAIAGDSVTYEQVVLSGGANTGTGNNTWSGITNFTGPVHITTPIPTTLTSPGTGGNSAQVTQFHFNKPDGQPALDNDLGFNSYYLSDDLGAQREVGRFTWAAPDANVATGVDGAFYFGLMDNNTLTQKYGMSIAALYPLAAGLTLGIQATNEWGSIYLAPDTAIKWNNATAVLQHSSTPNRLTLVAPTELHVPGIFYSTGTAIIGDQAADSVTIKGTGVHHEQSNQWGNTFYVYSATVLNTLMGLGAPSGADYLLFRSDTSTGTPTWKYHNIYNAVYAGLLSFGGI